MAISRKTTVMALSGAVLIGYLAYGEWRDRTAEKASTADVEAFRQTLQPVEVPEALKHLPNLLGQGYVRDLQQAAVLDPQLRGLLEAYVADPKLDRRVEMTEPILFAWVETSKRRPSIDQVLEQGSARIFREVKTQEDKRVERLLDKIRALEVVTGQQFFHFQGFETSGADVGTLSFKSGAVARSIDLPVEEGHYILPAAALSLLPQQTQFVENAYTALVGSLNKALLRGRYKYCLDHPLPGFEDMNYEKICRLELALASNVTAAPPTPAKVQ